MVAMHEKQLQQTTGVYLYIKANPPRKQKKKILNYLA
jgi:hypothetical protein